MRKEYNWQILFQNLTANIMIPERNAGVGYIKQ